MAFFVRPRTGLLPFSLSNIRSCFNQAGGSNLGAYSVTRIYSEAKTPLRQTIDRITDRFVRRTYVAGDDKTFHFPDSFPFVPYCHFSMVYDNVMINGEGHMTRPFREAVSSSVIKASEKNANPFVIQLKPLGNVMKVSAIFEVHQKPL